jgi:prepilin-type N-terminal cleavage/methylation domain-containing protein
MKHRPGLTLLEVLVAIFVAGVGMLALLVLFPLGALNMAQSLRDDRCAQAAAQAAALANALDLRHDSGTLAGFPASAFPAASLNVGKPVYLDPVGARYIGFACPGSVAGTSLPRCTTSLVAPPAGVAAGAWTLKWFSLGDDLSFDASGAAKTYADTGPTGFIDRGGHYTWAYVLRPVFPKGPPRTGTATPAQIDVEVVVYAGRDLQQKTGEQSYSATHTPGSNKVVLNYAGLERPALKRGSWLLDASPEPPTVAPQPRKQMHSFFYRVVDAEDLGAAGFQVEVDARPAEQITKVAVLENVAEVFVRGAGWRP